MPTTDLVFYREENGSVPALEWLDGLGKVKAIVKCRAKLMRLAALGHELRRPEADLLRDGIYELRIGLSHINYRLLYFFSGKDAVIVSHGFTKEEGPGERDRAGDRSQETVPAQPRRPFVPGVR